MTKEEILFMPAGREIDILVAQNVMKWHLVEEHGFLHWLDSDSRFQCGMSKGIDGFEDSEDFHLLHWHPSESVLWAWEVVEKGELIMLQHLTTDFYYCEYATKESNIFYAEAETAPLAICRAALLSTIIDS